VANASESQSYNWTRFGAGMPEVQVHDLDLNESLNTLTAATYGRGVYQLLLTNYQATPARFACSAAIRSGPGGDLTGDTTITADGTQKLQDASPRRR